jgi:hypothetical protein
MNLLEFLNKIIDDGIEAAKKDYKDKPHKLEGAVAGFEVCRGKTSVELLELLRGANVAITTAAVDHIPLTEYWTKRCYAAEIEWVCNCLSAALLNQGQEPLIPVTTRGFMKAAQVLGVQGSEARV